MPYANREQQLAAMRDWRARRKAERAAERKAEHKAEREKAPGSVAHMLGALPIPAAPSTRPTGAKWSAPAPRAPAAPSPRADLLDAYRNQRAGGLSDAQAQAEIRRQRETQRRQNAERTRDAAFSQRVTALTPRFIAEAQSRVSAAGCYTPADVLAEAQRLAAWHVRDNEVAPTPADPPSPRRISAPGRTPARPPLREDGAHARGQQALPIYTGRIPAPRSPGLLAAAQLVSQDAGGSLGAALVRDALRRQLAQAEATHAKRRSWRPWAASWPSRSPVALDAL